MPVVTYVNTSAAVKAECDICCTSGNAVKIVELLGADRVIFLPDEYLAKYVATQTKVQIIDWKGHCEVHERFTGDEVRSYRQGMEDLVVIAHPECPPDVLEASDFVGSTAQMIDFVRRQAAGQGADGHRVLDERQRRRRGPGRRVRAAVQSLPAHEADHALPTSTARSRRSSRGSRSTPPSPTAPGAPSSGCWRSAARSHRHA